MRGVVSVLFWCLVSLEFEQVLLALLFARSNFLVHLFDSAFAKLKLLS